MEAEAPTTNNACYTANSNLLHLVPLVQLLHLVHLLRMLHLVHLVKAGRRIGILDWKEAEAAAPIFTV